MCAFVYRICWLFFFFLFCQSLRDWPSYIPFASLLKSVCKYFVWHWWPFMTFFICRSCNLHRRGCLKSINVLLASHSLRRSQTKFYLLLHFLEFSAIVKECFSSPFYIHCTQYLSFCFKIRAIKKKAFSLCTGAGELQLHHMYWFSIRCCVPPAINAAARAVAKT